MTNLYQQYVFARNGVDYLYRTFTSGFGMDYERTQDSRAKEAVFYLAKNAIGAAADPKFLRGPERVRENSYLLEHLLDSEAVGWRGRPEKVCQIVENSLGILKQLFVERNYPVKTFMTGLQAESLIQYFEKTGDSHPSRAQDRRRRAVGTRLGRVRRRLSVLHQGPDTEE
jgi:hypothetical protein